MLDCCMRRLLYAKNAARCAHRGSETVSQSGDQSAHTILNLDAAGSGGSRNFFLGALGGSLLFIAGANLLSRGVARIS